MFLRNAKKFLNIISGKKIFISGMTRVGGPWEARIWEPPQGYFMDPKLGR